jgi:hypothetical protein
MGFCHLYGFNFAMLGKQQVGVSESNRLASLNQLVSRFFKARYFLKYDFLETRLGNNLGFISRSIYVSQVIVRGGMRWCIGNGEFVNLQKEPWLWCEEKSYITTSWFQEFESCGLVSNITMVHRGEEYIKGVEIQQQRHLYDKVCILVRNGNTH